MHHIPRLLYTHALTGQFKEAEALARQLLNTSGPEREEAKWMLRELQSMTTRVRA